MLAYFITNLCHVTFHIYIFFTDLCYAIFMLRYFDGFVPHHLNFLILWEFVPYYLRALICCPDSCPIVCMLWYFDEPVPYHCTAVPCHYMLLNFGRPIPCDFSCFDITHNFPLYAYYVDKPMLCHLHALIFDGLVTCHNFVFFMYPCHVRVTCLMLLCTLFMKR